MPPPYMEPPPPPPVIVAPPPMMPPPMAQPMAAEPPPPAPEPAAPAPSPTQGQPPAQDHPATTREFFIEPEAFEFTPEFGEYESGWGEMEGGFGEYEYEQPQRYAKPCPLYESGEVAKSKTEAGHLPSDVIEIPMRGTMIADFGVDWRHTKPSLERDPTLKAWLTSLIAALRKAPNYGIIISGFSDCVGNENNNAFLRSGRAQRVAQLLLRLAGPYASFLSSRIAFVGPAQPDDYVADNGTVQGRAQNRGALIEWSEVIHVEDKAPGKR
jgi:outer membrane protein OmpA-like peptidoglycan-associated protein